VVPTPIVQMVSESGGTLGGSAWGQTSGKTESRSLGQQKHLVMVASAVPPETPQVDGR